MIIIANDCGTEKDILSIAIHKDTVYYNNWEGQLKRFRIGVPNSCEILLPSGAAYNSMTVDKNGMVYLASETLARYDPYKKELIQLGDMPFYATGDMFFYKGKLLLAGWNPRKWTEHGLYEIIPGDLSQSSLYMQSQQFYGLLAYPVSCGSMKYFGIVAVSPVNSQLIELDLERKEIIGHPLTIPGAIQDAASVAVEEYRPEINTIKVMPASNCDGNNGSIRITAASWTGPVNYLHVKTGSSNSTGEFMNLPAGPHTFRITTQMGCSADTTIHIPANIPTAGCNDIFLPNAFTPNSDGRNDNFEARVPPQFTEVTMQVFNRGGTKVFESRGNQISWNGQYRGVLQPGGVYVYILQFTSGGAAGFLKGTITLVR